MRNVYFAKIGKAAALAATLSAGALMAQPVMPVQVVRVLDGDTVIVAGRSDSVRLANIDAPESAHRGRLGQPFSTASGNYLKRLVLNVTWRDDALY